MRPRGLATNLLTAAASLAVTAGAVETVARVAFRIVHGYPYAAHHAFLPDPALVYHNNPDYFVWAARPRVRDGFFFIPPLDDANPSQRLWILGGSTSAAQPDGSDWPAQLQDALADRAVRVVNMGHEGYGSSQLAGLWEHEHDRVRPASVVFFEGWNYRGALTSRRGFRPANAPSPFDGPLPRLSAALVDHSAAYGSAAAYLHKHSRRDPCGDTTRYPEMGAWEAELTAALARMARRDRVFLVLFPGLAMRDDVRPFLGRDWNQRCVAEHFAFYRAEYDDRLAVLERAAAASGALTLDARPAYRALPPDAHAACFRDFCHQTRAGNALLARTLRHELTRQGALPAG
jgi:hypothetical protein